MKKLLSILLVSAMVVSLAACGQQTSSPAVSTEASGEKSEKPAFDKLELLMFTGGYGDMWQEMVDLFKKTYPGVEVTAELNSETDDKVRARLMSDDVPDLIYVSDSTKFNQFEAAQSGMLRDMSDFIENDVTSDGRKVSEILNPSAIDNMKVGGKLYFPGIFSEYFGWFYNEKLYQDNGWEFPKNWEELNKLAPAMLEKGVEPFVYQHVIYGARGYVMTGLAAVGGEDAYRAACIDLEEGAWNGEAAHTVANNLNDLVKSGYFMTEALGMDFTQLQVDFMNNKLAMIPCGTWLEKEMEGYIPEDFKLRIAPLPMTGKDGKHYYSADQNKLIVPEAAKNVEAAKAFLGVMLSKEGQKIAAKYGNIPIVNDMDTESLKEYFSDSMLSIVEATQSNDLGFVNNIAYAWYPDLMDAIMNNLTDLVLGEITPDEFCTKMEEATKSVREDSSIAKYYTYEH